MKLIKPSFEIWKQPTSRDVEQLLNGMYDHVARCTRVCYQSKPREGESSKDFVLRTICKHESNIKNHLAMLEHATVYLTIPMLNKSANAKIAMDFYSTNKYTKWRVDDFNLYVTTNLRVIYENYKEQDLIFISYPTEHHPKRVTVSFITNIGVSRELNRHRVNSICEESTRYCNYNTDKYDKQITCVMPYYLKLNTGIYKYRYYRRRWYIEGDGYFMCNDADASYKFLKSCITAEDAYNAITKEHSAQAGRSVLPLCLKTQVVHTAFVDDWKHLFALRADGISGAPHPDMKHLMTQVKESFEKEQLL